MKKYLLLITLITLLILSSIYGISQKVRADRLEDSLSKEQENNANFRKQTQLQLDEARKAETKALEISKQQAIAGGKSQVLKKEK